MSRYNTQIFQNTTGFVKVAPGALVSVCAVSSNLTPVNPITTANADANGNISITVAAGTYDFFVTGTGITTYKYTQTVADDSSIVLIDSSYPGSDLGAKINAADTALGIKGGQIWVSKSAGTTINTAVTLHNSLVFIDDAIYTVNNTITVASGGVFIQGMGLDASNGSNLGTGLQWGGGAGQDILSVLGTAPNRLGKVILKSLWFLGSGSARYGLRMEKCDICSVVDCKFSNCATAGCYVVDSTGDKFDSCDFVTIPAYGLVLDWGTGQFTGIGLVFENQSSMTGQFLVVQGSGSGQSFYGTTMQVDNNTASWVGFVKVTGFDTNSSFASAPTGGVGAPVGPGFYNLNLTTGTSAGAPSQGADVLVDGTATNQPQDVVLVQCQFFGNSSSSNAIKADHSKGMKVIGGFSNGHTGVTFTTTSNATQPSMFLVTSLDPARIGGTGPVDIFIGNPNGLGSGVITASSALFNLGAVTAIGSVPGITGTGAAATVTTITGGTWSGTFKCTGTTGASTVTITPGPTAANGWNCIASDMTTRANLIQQTSNSQTTVTLTATSITQNDVISFILVAY